MCSEEPFCSGTPPRYAGSYRIRDADGDIIYWGDTTDLFEIWCSKAECLSASEHYLFEYVIKDI